MRFMLFLGGLACGFNSLVQLAAGDWVNWGAAVWSALSLALISFSALLPSDDA